MAMAQSQWPLPIEITKRIVELACWPEDKPRNLFRLRHNARRSRCAELASVCREWQHLVERHTFRDLRLDRARLADVDRIVCRRRQAYVRTVDLDVELERYSPDLYGAFETAEENARNSAIFTATLRLFFDVFSQWAPAGGGNGLDGDEPGIWFCFKVFSRSDATHCSEADAERRAKRRWSRRLLDDYVPGRAHDIGGDRYIHSILQLLPAAIELPVVGCISRLSSGDGRNIKERHISAAAWALIINSLPNAKKIDINLWDNEKKDLELRKRLRDEIGDAFARMRCPNAEVRFSCSYQTPKDHSSIPPTLIDAPGLEDAYARGLRTWARQLKRLDLSEIVIAPEVFYAAAPDKEEAASEWPYLEHFEINYAAVTPHGTWLLERNPEDSPYNRPSPIFDLELGQENLTIEYPAPEDLYEWSFRTVPVATEMDRIHRSLARAARRMPALRYLYLGTFDQAPYTNCTENFHSFLYRYDANSGVATAHWGSFPGYTPADDVVELWREVIAEVRGCQLEVVIDEVDV